MLIGIDLLRKVIRFARMRLAESAMIYWTSVEKVHEAWGFQGLGRKWKRNLRENTFSIPINILDKLHFIKVAGQFKTTLSNLTT